MRKQSSVFVLYGNIFLLWASDFMKLDLSLKLMVALDNLDFISCKFYELCGKCYKKDKGIKKY